MSTTELEVVVCTHQRAVLLARFLRSLGRAKVPQDAKVSLLVVANACTDRTPEVVEEVAVELLRPRGWRVRLVEERRPGKSHALNRALESLEGDWILFTDDDHRIDPCWLTRLSDTIREHPTADMLCGRVLPDWEGWEPDWVHDEGRWAIRPLPVPLQEWGECGRWLKSDERLPGGGNLMMRGEFARANGPFRTDLGPMGHDLGGGEDGEWIRRAVVGGGKLWYEPGLVQYHYVDPERLKIGYLLRKAYLRSRVSMELAPHCPVRVPLYLLRMLGGHLWGVVRGPAMRQRRYHLVRLAAAVGEMDAIRRRARQKG